MNVELRIALIQRFGSQINAAKPLQIDEPTLSRIVRGHRGPTPEQRKRFKKILGRDYFRKPKNTKGLEKRKA
jgi:plasmid maintenance system antidote protein VapI